MRVAWVYPEPDKRGRGNKGKASETDGFSQTRLKQARTVLAYSRELALSVRVAVSSRSREGRSRQ